MHDCAFEHGVSVAGTMPLNGWGVSIRIRLRAIYPVQKQFSQGTVKEFISDSVFGVCLHSNQTRQFAIFGAVYISKGDIRTGILRT